MNIEDVEGLEEELLNYPLLQYAILDRDQVNFLDHVRYVCETECPCYGKSWSCPPAVGTVDECRERCQKFTHVFLFTTIAEVNDITNMEETLATREAHEEVTRELTAVFRRRFGETLTLSTESCAICPKCSYPDGPCRHPDKMCPCVESHGSLVTELAEAAGIPFINGANVVTWFSLIWFNGKESECQPIK